MTPIAPAACEAFKMLSEQRLARANDEIDRTIVAFTKIGRKHGVIA